MGFESVVDEVIWILKFADWVQEIVMNWSIWMWFL